MCIRDRTETDIFFRGSQDVIGASKMDEKFLEEIRRQEKALKEIEQGGLEEEVIEEPGEPLGEPKVAPPSGQTTLFGGDV